MRRLRRRRHFAILTRFFALGMVAGRGRSEARQWPRRQLERRVRVRTLVIARHLRRRGLGWAEVAARIGVSAGTLRSWRAAWRRSRLAAVVRGRPLRRAAREVRNQVLAALALLGPQVSVASLRELFPAELVGKRELIGLRARFRRLLRRRGVVLNALRWRNDGGVWAMDFFHAEPAVDGAYPKVLVARDLGSGRVLATQPVPDESGARVRDVLRQLIAAHGPPLALKVDNGAGFVASETLELLERHDVLVLRSPPRTPRFNGAVEAGVGSVKHRAHLIAAACGRPGAWTCDDIEGARVLANETGRPRGADARTPDERWHDRLPMSDRASLREAARLATNEERARLLADPADRLRPDQERNAERIGITRALLACGQLQLRRSRFPLLIRNRK